MTTEETYLLLQDGGSIEELIEAVWVLHDNPRVPIMDVANGFNHEGLVHLETGKALQSRMKGWGAQELADFADDMIEKSRKLTDKGKEYSIGDKGLSDLADNLSDELEKMWERKRRKKKEK